MDQPVKIQYHSSPYGELIIGAYNEQICLCDWANRKLRNAVDSRIQKGLKTGYSEERSDVVQEAIRQLEEYFDKKRTQFDLPLLTIGTAFQKNVWSELMKIPYGTTETYMGLSKRMGNVAAIRAVAAANGANAISIFIPCHRIIGSGRQLVGYAGGLPAKKKLLALESRLQTPELDFDVE